MVSDNSDSLIQLYSEPVSKPVLLMGLRIDETHQAQYQSLRTMPRKYCKINTYLHLSQQIM